MITEILKLSANRAAPEPKEDAAPSPEPEPVIVVVTEMCLALSSEARTQDGPPLDFFAGAEPGKSRAL